MSFPSAARADTTSAVLQTTGCASVGGLIAGFGAGTATMGDGFSLAAAAVYGGGFGAVIGCVVAAAAGFVSVQVALLATRSARRRRFVIGRVLRDRCLAADQVEPATADPDGARR